MLPSCTNETETLASCPDFGLLHVGLQGSVKCLKVNTCVEIQLDNAKTCSGWHSHSLLLWPLSKAQGPQIWNVLPLLLASVLDKGVYPLTAAPIPPLRVYLLFCGGDEHPYCSLQLRSSISFLKAAATLSAKWPLSLLSLVSRLLA